jgi:hypothetical protein
LVGCASESDHPVSDEATATIKVAFSQAEDKANIDKAFRRLAEITYDRAYTYFTVKSIELTDSGVKLKAKMGNDCESLKSLTICTERVYGLFTCPMRTELALNLRLLPLDAERFRQGGQI